MHNPAVRQGLGLQESQAISSGIPSLRHSCFRRGGSPEIFVYPDILGHFSYSGRVPVDSRGRRVRSEKVFRDYLRDALSGLARENCRRDVLMQYPCCHSPRQGGCSQSYRFALDYSTVIRLSFSYMMLFQEISLWCSTRVGMSMGLLRQCGFSELLPVSRAAVGAPSLWTAWIAQDRYVPFAVA